MPGPAPTDRKASPKEQAIVIGGSMSGLFAGLQLRARGFAVDIYERVDSELSGRGAGIVAQPNVPKAMRALGIDTADLGVEMTTRKILDAEGRTVVEARLPADADGVGAALPHPARCISGRALSPWRRAEGLRAGRPLGHGAFQRWPQRQGRSPDRRRWHPLDGARAAPARTTTALRRICRLARRCCRSRPSRRRSIASCSSS